MILQQNVVLDERTKQQHLKIRSVILGYNNNPTGASLTEKQAIQLADFLDSMLQKYPEPGFSLILDEVYLGIFFSREYFSIFSVASERLLNSTFLVLSASKGLGAMPGLRAGFCLCPNTSLIRLMVNIQMACSGNCSILSQIGLQASLSHLIEHPGFVLIFVQF